MERKNKALIYEAVFIFIMFLAGFISFFVLPDTIAVQWNGLEASSYKSKYFIFLPALVGVFLIPLKQYLAGRYLFSAKIIETAMFTLLIILFTCQIYMVVYSFFSQIQLSISTLIISELILGIALCIVFKIKTVSK